MNMYLKYNTETISIVGVAYNSSETMPSNIKLLEIPQSLSHLGIRQLKVDPKTYEVSANEAYANVATANSQGFFSDKLNELETRYTSELIGNPSYIKLTGWADNQVIARRILDGSADAADTKLAREQMTSEEKTYENAELSWATKITKVSVPYARKCFSLITGLRREAEENFTSDGDLNSQLDGFSVAVRGIDYDEMFSLEENYQRGNVSGVYLDALEYKEQLLATLM